MLYVEGDDLQTIQREVKRIIDLLPVLEGEYEPRVNVLVWTDHLFMDCYILCAILSLLPKKVYKYFKYLFYTVGYLVTATEWFLYNRFWLRYTPTTIQLLIETNSDEAGDFCRAFLLHRRERFVRCKVPGIACRRPHTKRTVFILQQLMVQHVPCPLINA